MQAQQGTATCFLSVLGTVYGAVFRHQVLHLCIAARADCLADVQEIFKEMHRVLKPGGLAVMSFSNRCFPTKGEGCFLSLPPQAVLCMSVTYYDATLTILFRVAT